MRFRNSIFAFLFLCLAIGALYLVAKKKEEKALSDKESKKILKIDADTADSIRLKSHKGSFTFEKSESGDNWEITSPVKAKADKTQLDKLTKDLKDLNQQRSFEVSQKELSDYGLNPPLLSLEISKNNKAETLLLGQKNPDETMQYAKLGDSLSLKLVDATIFPFKDKELKDLRNKRLFDFGKDEVTKIVFEQNKKKFVIEKSGSDFKLVEPLSTKADAPTVKKIIANIATIEAQDFPSEDSNKNPSKWGFNKPTSEITLFLKDKNQKIFFIGKDSSQNDTFYAKSSDDKFVIEVKSSLKKTLLPTIADLINRRISDNWEKADVAKLIISSDNKTKTVEMRDDLWILSEYQDLADQSKINNILQRLKGLSAEEFISKKPLPEHSLGKPHLTVTLSGKSGEQIAEYRFGKYFPVNKMFLSAGPDKFVYKIASAVPEVIKKDFKDLRNKRLSTLKRFKIEKASISFDDVSVNFKKGEGNKWLAQSKGKLNYAPNEDKANNDALKILDFMFKNNITGFVDTYDSNASEKQFGFDKPIATLTASQDDDKKETVLIGKNDPIGEYAFARNLSRDNVYKIKLSDLNLLKARFKNKTVKTDKE